jgi:hypothetical protein
MVGSTLFDVEGLSRTGLTGDGRPIRVTQEDIDEFATAVAAYKESSGRLFPTCSELLEILKALGYAKRIWGSVEGWEIRFGEPSVVSSG